MLKMERILFPVDYSVRSRATVPAVRYLAGHFGSEVTLLHVVEPNLRSAVPEKAVAQAEAALHEFALAQFDCRPPRELVTVGDPAGSTTAEANAGNFDLVVMPTRGCGIFRRFLVGSVTAKVLNDTPSPVWTSAHLEHFDAGTFLPIRRVLCAVDFGPRSAEVLRYASELAREFKAILCVGHAIPWMSIAFEGTWAPNWRGELAALAREALVAQVASENLDAEIEVVEGPVHWGLADLSQRWAADMLVIGRTRPGGNRIGSHVHGIVAHSPCPVISI